MDDISISVQKFYDEVGSHFSRTRQKTYGGSSANWKVTDRYLKLLKPGQRVLDVGCGNGKLVTGLVKGVEYLGVDFSHTLLAEARRLHPDHEFRYVDVLDPVHWATISTYDALFCVALLHHIPERAQQLYILKEMKQHLKNNGLASSPRDTVTRGGFLYLTVWNLWQEKFLPYHVGNHVEVPYNKKWNRYCVAYTIESLSELVIEAGLSLEEIYFANKKGEKVNIVNGENLVVVAH